MSITLHPAKSYQILEKVMTIQNKGKANAERLKAAHMEAMKAMIRLLKLEIGKIQSFGGKGYREDRLHNLRTNCKQLAGMLHRSERTVRNLINRLMAFGWIGKIFHGSNASFEIVFNPGLLHIQDNEEKGPWSVADRFALPPTLPDMRQILPDTLSRVPRDTRKPNKLSGLTSDAGRGPADEVTHKRPDTGAGYHPSSETPPVNASPTVPDTEVPGAKKVPPAALPGEMADVLAVVAPKDRVRMEQYVDHVYDYALAELDQFFPGWIAASVRRRGRVALAEFYAYSNPKCWKDATLEFVERIDIVGKHLERKFQAGKRCFLPLPHTYFDHRNPKGFAGSKAWFKENRQEKKMRIINAEINRCLKDYWRARDSKRMDATEALRKISQYLHKRGGRQLFDLFSRKLNARENFNSPARQ